MRLGACCNRISRQKLLRRLRREIDTLRALDGCPSSIAFEGAFETEGHVYLIMEVCHGGDLETLLKVRLSSIAPSTLLLCWLAK
jgi:serine/threonine protein kinase